MEDPFLVSPLNTPPVLKYLVLSFDCYVDFVAFVIIVEPVGSVPPKISVGERRKDAEARVETSLSIFCPAQSYPVPAYR